MFKRLLKDNKGYGTVELLLIIGGLGLLCTGIIDNLDTKLAGSGADSASSKVSNNITTMIDNWD